MRGEPRTQNKMTTSKHLVPPGPGPVSPEPPWTSGPGLIPNFAWVEEGRLARGMQPELTARGYKDLAELGIAAVLTLRPEREYPDSGWRAYDIADERALCDAHGLTLHHIECADFQAPNPADVVRALAIVREESERGRAVYVHCLAGVGRTGVISGAWQMLRGTSGTDALRDYAWFYEELRSRRVPHREPLEYLQSVGAHYQAWVLTTIAKALGMTAEIPPGFVRPRPPANGKNWRRRFEGDLRRAQPGLMS
jgi:protein-tyrosine phosphatase